jgi:hypothetical protein
MTHNKQQLAVWRIASSSSMGAAAAAGLAAADCMRGGDAMYYAISLGFDNMYPFHHWTTLRRHLKTSHHATAVVECICMRTTLHSWHTVLYN